ncbi:MAG: DciA family protein [Burkholderiaceae bacterium]
MKTSARPIHSWLEQETSFRAVAARVDRLVALQAAIATACPRIPMTVVSIDGETLTVSTPSAAWAARLRQLEPTLRAALEAERAKVNRIRIVPQRTGMARAEAPKPPKRPIPSNALGELKALCETVEGSHLKEALTNLLRRHRGGR